MRLSDTPRSARVTVRNVFERDRALLEYLDGLAVRPGAEIDVVKQNVDDTVTLRVGGRTAHLGRGAAGKVWVEPVG